MLKKSISAFISLLGITFLISCKSKPGYVTAAGGTSLLWEVTGNGLKKPSYILGTMHLMCKKDAELSANAKKIIKEVGQVYMEIDMDNAGELFSGLLNQGSPGKSLSDVLSPEEYERVASFFGKFKTTLPFQILEKQYPILISSTLYELFLPCDEKSGIELNIIDEAFKQKKETKGLETFEFQQSIFEKIPYEMQAKELLKTIDSLSEYRNFVVEMIKVYKSQDIEKLHAMTMEDAMGVSSFMDVLLYDRNRNWVKKFPQIAAEKSTLIAVGAGHLGGRLGVIHLLREKGYNLRPIEN